MYALLYESPSLSPGIFGHLQFKSFLGRAFLPIIIHSFPRTPRVIS